MMFTFECKTVLPLLEHSKRAKKHRSLYGQAGTEVPGLWLVKDEGVYVMSNADPGLKKPDGKRHQVVYALGFGPEVHLGGDDFVELIRAEWLKESLKQFTTISILLTETQIEIRGG